METYRLFWGILTFGTLVWYSLVTLYVAIKGVTDIRQMLGNLASESQEPEQS